MQALLRELDEETGLSFKDGIAFLSAYQFSRAEDNSSTQGLVFLIQASNSAVRPAADSIAEFIWINPHDILDYKDKTIYGMEVHVRNALIALKRNLFVDWKTFSVTNYQNSKSQLTRADFDNIL